MGRDGWMRWFRRWATYSLVWVIWYLWDGRHRLPPLLQAYLWDHRFQTAFVIYGGYAALSGWLSVLKHEVVFRKGLRLALAERRVREDLDFADVRQEPHR